MYEAEIEVCRFRVRIERLRLAIQWRAGQKERNMREVRGLAETMRDKIKALKSEALAATTAFQSEHAATTAAIGKVKSLTKELGEARKEVDAMLGEAGSNFPTQEEETSSTPVKASDGGKPSVDINGVTTKHG